MKFQEYTSYGFDDRDSEQILGGQHPTIKYTPEHKFHMPGTPRAKPRRLPSR